MKIGSHVSNKGDLMLEASIIEALDYQANCFMVYLGAPQNTARKDVSLWHISEMKNIARDHNINLEDIVIHAPYIVNPARNDNEKRGFAVEFLTSEVKNVDLLGAKYLVLHPGSATDCDNDVALDNVVKTLNEIIASTPNNKTVICLETMAGKGNEVGRNFKELKYIIDNVSDKSRIGICLDTCHIHDAGYDIINHYDDVIKEFDDIIGLSYLHVLHINDSKNECGSHKDRHENFGFGHMGFNTLMKFIDDERFIDLPHILETPYVKINDKLSVPPYKEEIAMIKENLFNPNLMDVIKMNLS